MKKMLFVLPLAVLLFVTAFTLASAGADFEDPKLCVEGEWLLVDAAAPQSIAVVLPQNVHFGNQAEGGCKTPGPNVPLIKNVTTHGQRGQMLVKVEGALATNPIIASYDGKTQTKKNEGKQVTFTFKLK